MPTPISCESFLAVDYVSAVSIAEKSSRLKMPQAFERFHDRPIEGLAVEPLPCSRSQGRMLMGYASYLEDITEKAHENRMMRGTYEGQVRPKPVYVQVSPPLQPTIASITPEIPAKADAETAAKRTRALHEKHVLAIYELMPGKSWRH